MDGSSTSGPRRPASSVVVAGAGHTPPTARAAATPGCWPRRSTTPTSWRSPHFGRDEAARLAVLGRDNVAEMLGLSRGAWHRLRPGAQRTAARGPVPGPARGSARGARARPRPRRRPTSGCSDARRGPRRDPLPDLYQGALFNPGGGILDPVKLALGLKREALRRGVHVLRATRGDGPRERGRRRSRAQRARPECTPVAGDPRHHRRIATTCCRGCASASSRSTTTSW